MIVSVEGASISPDAAAHGTHRGIPELLDEALSVLARGLEEIRELGAALVQERGGDLGEEVGELGGGHGERGAGPLPV